MLNYFFPFSFRMNFIKFFTLDIIAEEFETFPITLHYSATVIIIMVNVNIKKLFNLKVFHLCIQKDLMLSMEHELHKNNLHSSHLDAGKWRSISALHSFFPPWNIYMRNVIRLSSQRPLKHHNNLFKSDSGAWVAACRWNKINSELRWRLE